jgi:drug/metabolite transporter (DMT)-like permease
MKNIGLVIIVIGALMIAYTGFTFITKEKVVDIGPIEINKEKEHPVQWSPIVGVALVIGGSILLIANNKK